MGHTLTIHDRGNGEPNSYWVEFGGNTKPQKATVNDATKDANDSITQTSNGYRVEGTVYGGRDAYQYYGKRLGMAFKYPDRIRLKVDDNDWHTPAEFAETKSWSASTRRDSDGNGSNGGDNSGDGASSGEESTATSSDGPTQRHGITFENVVHAVRDLGMDPDGNEPIDGQLQKAAADDTLIVFPGGDFAKHGKTVMTGLQNFGLRGLGVTRFVAPKGCNEKLVVIDRGVNTLFENITINLRAKNATPGLHLGANDGLDVRYVRFRGQGIHQNSTPRGKGSGNPEVKNALNAHVRSPDGTGRVKNVIAHNGGLMGAYNKGDGRIGIFTGRENRGTLTIEGCNFEGFPNNGLYTSRHNGVVQVEGGVFRNNDISQVRLASKDSYVQNALLEVDMQNSRSPNPKEALNTRGVRFDGPVAKTHGAEVRDSTIRIVSTPHSDGAIVANQDTGAFGAKNVRLRLDADGVRGVVGKRPCGIGNRGSPPEPFSGIIERATIVGEGGAAEAVRIVDRPNTKIHQLCVSSSGKGRVGVRCTGSPGTTVSNSNLNVDGEPVEGAEVRNITTNKHCPSDGQSDVRDDPWDLTIEGDTDGRVVYICGYDGTVEKSDAMGAAINKSDDIGRSTVRGELFGGKVSYRIKGSSRVFVAASGPMTLYRNGTETSAKDLRTGT